MVQWKILPVTGHTDGRPERSVARIREEYELYSGRAARKDVTQRGTVEQRMAAVADQRSRATELDGMVVRAKHHVAQTPQSMCPPATRHLVDDGTGWVMWVEGRRPDGRPNWQVCPNSSVTSVRRGPRGSLACTQLPCRASTCESCGPRMQVAARAAILAVIEHYRAAGWSGRLIAGDLGRRPERWPVDGEREWVTVGPWTALLWSPRSPPTRPKRGPTSALVAACLDPHGRTPDGDEWVGTASEWSASMTVRSQIVAVRDELLTWRRLGEDPDRVLTTLTPHGVAKALLSYQDEQGEVQAVDDVHLVDATAHDDRNTTTVILSRVPSDQWHRTRSGRPPMGDVGDLYTTEMLREILPPARRTRSDDSVLAEIHGTPIPRRPRGDRGMRRSPPTLHLITDDLMAPEGLE